MPLVAKVAVEKTGFTFDKLFSYAIPDALQMAVCRGVRVLVPFGKGNRLSQGMVFSIDEEKAIGLKPVISVLDEAPVLTEEGFAIVSFMVDTTFCTYYDAVRCLIPSGLSVAAATRFSIAPGFYHDTIPNMPPDQQQLIRLMLSADGQREIDLLFSGPGSGNRILTAEAMSEKGILVKETLVTRKVGDKVIRLVSIAPGIDPDNGFTPKQREVLQVLREHGALPEREAAYLAGVTESVVKNLIRKEVLLETEKEVLRTPLPRVPMDASKILLSAKQQEVYEGISALYQADEANVALLFGVTGSGKTSIFIRLIEDVLSDGRQVILMVPEIALTPQMLAKFRGYFGDAVAVIHSSLSVGERLDENKRILSGQAKIVIGTRSSVFAPCENIGLIIMDEEGEHSYKSDSSPRYHAREIAKLRCVRHKATLLLASATPSVESFHAARTGRYHLFTLKERFGTADLPDVRLINMMQEEQNFNFSPISDQLAEALLQNYEQGQQSIVLINRRGYSTFAVCLDCGEVVRCPNCSVSLTYHKANGYLMCHYCGYTRKLEEPCSSCGSNHLRTVGTGTQRVEDLIANRIPSARLLRMDTDTTYSRYAYEEKFSQFEAGEYDIMIGTQMVAKGLNFPNVTLVGVLGADQYLYSGDFRSGEKTFSLITQVVGRSGRYEKHGCAYIQTISPEHPVIQDAARQDYEAFYADEIVMRKTALQPPFCDLAVIGLSSSDETAVRQTARQLHTLLGQALTDTVPQLPCVLLGVSEAGVYRLNGRFRLRIILKCKNNRRFRNLLRGVIAQAAGNRLFSKTSIYVDMNGDIG